MMMNWLLKHPGKVNAFTIAFNFWLAALYFADGGYWLILSALHMATCLLIAHYELKRRERLAEWHRERDEIDRIFAELEREARRVIYDRSR